MIILKWRIISCFIIIVVFLVMVYLLNNLRNIKTLTRDKKKLRKTLIIGGTFPRKSYYENMYNTNDTGDELEK